MLKLDFFIKVEMSALMDESGISDEATAKEV